MTARPPKANDPEDPLVVGGHGGQGDALGPQHPFINMLDHGFPAQIGQGLSRETARFVTGRDDADDLIDGKLLTGRDRPDKR